MQGNNSNEQVLNTIMYYGGLANLKIIALNPTGEELRKILNVEDLKKEPEYINIMIKSTDGTEQAYNKIVFYLSNVLPVLTGKKNEFGVPITENATILCRKEFLVAPRQDIASTGAMRTINNLGDNTWQSIEKLKANEKMNWFSKEEPLHHAFVGEALLLKFMREYLNLETKSSCTFANVEKIMNGDLSEIRASIKPWVATNMVTCLLGAKKDGEKVFQQVYGKCFSRPTVKNSVEKFRKALNEPYGDFDAIYPSDLVLSYIDTSEEDKPDAPSAAPSTKSWV